MEISPQRVRSAQFTTVRRGLDPHEVAEFLNEVADEIEQAQNRAAAMEARARAAVARVQELSERSQRAAPGGSAPPPPPPVDQTETISRTLRLAQKTADEAIAEARYDADRLRREAKAEAERMIHDAKADAVAVGIESRNEIEREVSALGDRRKALVKDVDGLERFLIEQRGRLREAATELIDLTERIPSGLGEVRSAVRDGLTDEPPAGPVDSDDDRDHGADEDDDPSTEEAAESSESPDDADAGVADEDE